MPPKSKKVGIDLSVANLTALRSALTHLEAFNPNLDLIAQDIGVKQKKNV